MARNLMARSEDAGTAPAGEPNDSIGESWRKRVGCGNLLPVVIGGCLLIESVKGFEGSRRLTLGGANTVRDCRFVVGLLVHSLVDFNLIFQGPRLLSLRSETWQPRRLQKSHTGNSGKLPPRRKTRK